MHVIRKGVLESDTALGLPHILCETPGARAG
jgi:hypothetical protein